MSIRDKVRTKRVIVPAVAALAIVGVGGVAWAVVGDDDDRLTSGQRTDAGDAALAEVGSGRVLEVDVDDDTDEGGARVYEVEVVDSDGARWDVTLDDAFEVLVVDADRDDDRDDDSDDRYDDGAAAPSGDPSSTAGNDTGTNGTVDDDAPISEAERAEVAAAAEGAVEGGRAVDVDRSDDRGEAWEVEVVDATGVDWDVTLDADLAVLDSRRD